MAFLFIFPIPLYRAKSLTTAPSDTKQADSKEETSPRQQLGCLGDKVTLKVPQPHPPLPRPYRVYLCISV